MENSGNSNRLCSAVELADGNGNETQKDFKFDWTNRALKVRRTEKVLL